MKAAFALLRQPTVTVLFALVLVTAVAAALWFSSEKAGFRSVELNLTELSPNGAGGGYAVPASGASTPGGIQYSCASSGTSVTLQWGGSSYQGALPAAKFFGVRGFEFLRAHAGGGGGQDVTPPPSHNHSVPAPVTYNLQVGGQSWNGLGSNSHTVGINPGQSYTASVQACAGGGCSSWQSRTFSCPPPPPPPNVDVTVRNDTDDPGGSFVESIGEIDPIDQISIRWDSDGTSCSASTNPAGGNFSTGGSTDGTDTDVVEPYAGLSTVYTVTCVNGASAPRSDSVVVGANIGLPPKMEAIPEFVQKGKETTLRWDLTTNLPSTCSLRGPGVDQSTMATTIGEVTPEINGESTFTLTCPGGTLEVRVEMLPVVQET